MAFLQGSDLIGLSNESWNRWLWLGRRRPH